MGARTWLMADFVDRSIFLFVHRFVSFKPAVGAYTRWARRYALRGLLVRLLMKERGSEGARALAGQLLLPGDGATAEGDAEWPYRRTLLQTEFEGQGGQAIREVLLEAVETENAVAAGVEASKRRDDARGGRIIDDYMAARGPLEEDKVVTRAAAEAALVARAVELLLETSPVASLPLEAFV